LSSGGANRSFLDLAVGTVTAEALLRLSDLALEEDSGVLGPLILSETGAVGGDGFLEVGDALLEGGFVGRLEGRGRVGGKREGEDNCCGSQAHEKPRSVE
jgi:hypothetical protein